MVDLFALVRDMLARGLTPDSYTLVCLYDCVCEMRHVEPLAVCRLVLKRVEALQAAYDIAPNLILFNTLLAARVHLQPREVVPAATLAHYRSTGIEPDLVTYHVLLLSLCEQARERANAADAVKQAAVLINDMEQRGLAPTLRTYNVLLPIFRWDLKKCDTLFR